MRAESVTFHGALGNEPRLLQRQVTLGQKFHSRPQLLCGHDWFRLGEVGSVCQTSAAAKIAEDSDAVSTQTCQNVFFGVTNPPQPARKVRFYL